MRSLISSLLSILQHTTFFGDNGMSGYFYGYDLARMTPIEPVYCEIAGYGLSLHGFLYTLFNDNELRKLLERISKFLIFACSMTPSSVAPYGFYPKRGLWSTLIYSFDNGVIAKGFFDVHRILDDKRALECGLRICKWLIDVMQHNDGSFKAAYDYKRNEFVDSGEWYGNGGCLHGKLTIPLLLAWKLSDNYKFRISTEKILSWLLRLQLNSGAFRAKENADYVFHHAHCYALEGLIYAWYVLGDDKYLNAVIRGAEWLARVQHKSGGIPDFYPFKFVKRLVTDATAQAVRIWLILYKITGEERWLRYAERGLKFLEKNLFKRGRIQGALPAYIYAVGPVKYRVPRIHTWSIMFAIQAFIFYNHLDKISLSEMLESLF